MVITANSTAASCDELLARLSRPGQPCAPLSRGARPRARSPHTSVHSHGAEPRRVSQTCALLTANSARGAPDAFPVHTQSPGTRGCRRHSEQRGGAVHTRGGGPADMGRRLRGRGSRLVPSHAGIRSRHAPRRAGAQAPPSHGALSSGAPRLRSGTGAGQQCGQQCGRSGRRPLTARAGREPQENADRIVSGAITRRSFRSPGREGQASPPPAPSLPQTIFHLGSPSGCPPPPTWLWCERVTAARRRRGG